MKKIIITKEILYNLFVVENNSSYQIAKILGVSASTVRNKLREYEISVENKKESNKIDLTLIQYDLLLGGFLGDTNFKRKTDESNTYMSILHAEDQKDYCKVKFEILKNLVNQNDLSFRNRDQEKDGTNRQNQYRFTSKSLPCLNKFSDLSIEHALHELNENSLTVWFLDDGHHNYPKGKNKNSFYELSIGRFTEEQSILTLEVLKNKFDVNPKLQVKSTKKEKTYYNLVFDIYDSYYISQIMRNSELGQLLHDSIPYKFIECITLNRVVKEEKFKITILEKHKNSINREL